MLVAEKFVAGGEAAPAVDARLQHPADIPHDVLRRLGGPTTEQRQRLAGRNRNVLLGRQRHEQQGQWACRVGGQHVVKHVSGAQRG
ncbi:hypothetical protein [Thauera humireducens]|uniref:hypothetical protein n=1 Tax=Thauera humireducens TaxID=1134435 RepID=UPI00311DFCC4